MSELAEVIARVNSSLTDYLHWQQMAAHHGWPVKSFSVSPDDAQALCDAASRVAQLEGELAEVKAALTWLDDHTTAIDAANGVQVEIRFYVYADPEAELPSLLETVELGRQWVADQRAQADAMERE